MAGNIYIPYQTVEKYSQIENIEEYLHEVRMQIGNAGPKLATNHVFCGVFITSNIIHGSKTLVKTPEAMAEDIWQGKMMFVLGKGNLCFEDDPSVRWGEFNPAIGAFVTAKIIHCTQLEVANYPCRIVQDQHVDAEWPDPRKVW